MTSSVPQDLQWLVDSNAVYPPVPIEPMPPSRLTLSKAAYLTRVTRDWLARPDRLTTSEEYTVRELLSLLLESQSPRP